MKNILFINHTNDVFGAENVLLKIIDYCLEEAKQNVHVLEPKHKNESHFRLRLEKLGCQNIISLPYKNLGNSRIRSYLVMFYNLYAIMYMYFYVKKNKINVIYSNTSTTCVGIILAFLTRKEHIWHIHEPTDIEHGWVPSLINLYNTLLKYKRNKTIFVTGTQCSQWKKYIVNLHNSSVIYNPINEFPASNNNNEQTIFGYLGSREKRKNIPMLLNAFAIASKTNNNVQLVLSQNIGDPDDVVKKQIIHLQIEDLIVEKTIINAGDFYNMIDVLVLPSLSETWGLVVLEAMHAGKATIITSNTGLTELLQNNIHTLFVNPNDEQSIANAMIAMTNKRLRKKIVENGLDFIDKQNFNFIFKQKILALVS